MKDYPLHFHVEKGDIISPNFQRNLRRLIASYKRNDGEYTLSIKKRSKKKTNPQLAYFHLCAKIIADYYTECGDYHTMPKMKQRIKATFGLTESIIDFKGVSSDRLVSLADYTREEMSGLIERMVAWVSVDLPDLNLPDPNEAKVHGIL